MIKAKPLCQTIRPWLKANLGREALGVLTGTDNRALDAAVHILAMMAYENAQSLVLAKAFGIVVQRMQPTARHLAYHAIAHAMHWPDRARIWAAANLEDCTPGLCAHEPGARKGGDS